MSKYALSLAEDMQEINERIGRLASVPFLKEYVDYPGLAENRLALLFVFLCDAGLGSERAKTLCTATGLMQLGLDTHETVKTHYEAGETADRNRQLTVLAGDLFSSHYYHLLAKAGEVMAIRILSESIQVVNEAKMRLYLLEKSNQLTWESYVSLRKTIDTALYIRFVEHFSIDASVEKFWKSLFEQTSAVEGMVGEWEQLQWGQRLPFGFSRYLTPKSDSPVAQVLTSVEAKAMEWLGVCEQMVRSFQSIENQRAVSWVTSRIMHRVSRLKRLVEEL
ncbi:heptaprenyl diphosphate synthase [Brevibacillus fluminis]|uniref:Heptaprenyl diphosphate synthase n=1 Tax=Brevibacillus fluminis TaxID=511487 RepID=A0A3M8D178_9BACL|nr:heptaprenyl diphosphate synthase component 1 [Brevibacillus fluminis]RNB81628.1 heptaprenyl diphosphate synthase [Brevibacillus fluminis]